MAKTSFFTHQRTYTSNNIISGALIGGLVGVLLGFLDSTGMLIIPGISTLFLAIPFDKIISGALLGIIIGGLTICHNQ